MIAGAMADALPQPLGQDMIGAPTEAMAGVVSEGTTETTLDHRIDHAPPGTLLPPRQIIMLWRMSYESGWLRVDFCNF